jgi:hypothetical protein
MVMNIFSLDVRSIGGSDVLAGRLAGEAARPFFERALGSDGEHGVVVLDFREVHLATSSYFLGAFEWLWTSAGVRARGLFPVLANVNQETQDEVSLALKAKGFRALFGTFGYSGLSDVVPFNLESDAAETYELIAGLKEATATDLFRLNPKIQPTGWSNRLALLYEHRLLRRRKQGRQLFYALSWR